MLRRFARPTLAALAALLVAGCGSDSPTGGSGTGDTTPPGIASVTPVDIWHVQVTFTETVEEQSADAPRNYTIIEGAPVRSTTTVPGQEIPVRSAVLGTDGKSVLLTNGAPMQEVPYDVLVRGVRDAAGNAISGQVSGSFTGSTQPDVTPPVIISRSPAPNATNVGIGESVFVRFSETMYITPVLLAFHWASASGPGTVAWVATTDDGTLYVFTPVETLDRDRTYTVSIGAEASDLAGNQLASTSWSFQTTSQIDETPPALAASSPANGATRVPLATNISMTFTEPIVPVLREIFVLSDTIDGTLEWSNGGRTFTFDPDQDLLPNTQYALFIPPGGITDPAGNGNEGVIGVVFTTGNTLASGAFAGTLGGDPSSTTAANPQGAIVVAADRQIFEDVFGITGHTIAGTGGSYEVARLPDGTYWPFAIMDSNNDGVIDPEAGDALGVYGVDFGTQSGAPDSVPISGGGGRTGIDFFLFDPVALAGRVVYEGSAYPSCCYQYFVGVFDTTGFDPGNPASLNPIYGTEGILPHPANWWINQIDHGLEPGTYHVAAFLDVNGNTELDPGDPLGVYGSAGMPIAVSLANGADVLDITIGLQDPVPALRGSQPVNWKSRNTPVETQTRKIFRRIAAYANRRSPS